MTTLFSAQQWDRERSMQLLNLTPEYGQGDCCPSACLGHRRLIDQAKQHEAEPQAVAA